MSQRHGDTVSFLSKIIIFLIVTVPLCLCGKFLKTEKSN